MNQLLSVVAFVLALVVIGAVIWGCNALFELASGKLGTTLDCMTCGADAKVKSVTRGNTAIELILWLCFLVPGLIYSVWRVSTRYSACSKCGATVLVPLDAPAAVAHRRTTAGS